MYNKKHRPVRCFFWFLSIHKSLLAFVGHSLFGLCHPERSVRIQVNRSPAKPTYRKSKKDEKLDIPGCSRLLAQSQHDKSLLAFVGNTPRATLWPISPKWGRIKSATVFFVSLFVENYTFLI